MPEALIALAIFICLLAASLGAVFVYEKLPRQYRHDDTNSVVRLIAGLFVMMASLVLGLMVNSARGTFETIDHDVHTIATEIILLDRAMREYGPETDEARLRLAAYVQRALTGTAPTNDPLVVGDRSSEQLLDAVGAGLKAIKPGDPDHAAMMQGARQQFQKIVALRWTLVEQSEGTIPLPLLFMLVAWLVLIFASFGYRAPKNLVVGASFVLAAGLIAGSIYLILDMDVPFSGPIQVSGEPLARALAEIRR